jgi:hypothetical protein
MVLEKPVRIVCATARGALRSRLSGIAPALLLLGCANLHAAAKILRIDPQQTDSAIAEVHGPHLALYDPQVTSADRLLVFFVGTRARAESGLTIESAFAKWGYHAISLDYEDNVIAVSCAHSLDAACFDRYREAIVSGAPGSEKISVDPANSILNRLQKLLVYLVKTDPDGKWGEFVSGGQPVWGRIVVAGHSQGSGHAAFIGKMFQVDKVLMFSGPQDYLDDLDEPAPWESRPSATPVSRFFAFLNENDPFNVHHQIANCALLMGLAKPETLMVEPGQVIRGDPQILINDETVRPHGSTLLPEFENVWQYMARAGEEETQLKSETPSQPPAIPQH